MCLLLNQSIGHRKRFEGRQAEAEHSEKAKIQKSEDVKRRVNEPAFLHLDF